MAKPRKLTSSQQRYHRIYREIRDRICLLEYPPGAPISEEELAQEFGVSRTPIRRALSWLEAEGLVESRVGVATLVTDIDLRTLKELYAFRIELIGLIGHLDPVKPRRRNIEQTRRILEEIARLRESPDRKQYLRLNMQFYEQVMSVVGNTHLKEVLQNLYLRITRVWLCYIPEPDFPSEIEIFQEEVTEVLRAMEVGDYPAVGMLRKAHVSMSFRRLRNYIDMA